MHIRFRSIQMGITKSQFRTNCVQKWLVCISARHVFHVFASVPYNCAEFTYPHYCAVLILRRASKISNKMQLLGRKEYSERAKNLHAFSLQLGLTFGKAL